MKTMTVSELAMGLLSLMKEDKKVGGYKVFMSVDPEGNGYGTISPTDSFQFGEADEVLMLYPYEEGLDFADIAPKEEAKITAEIDEMKKKGEL